MLVGRYVAEYALPSFITPAETLGVFFVLAAAGQLTMMGAACIRVTAAIAGARMHSLTKFVHVLTLWALIAAEKDVVQGDMLTGLRPFNLCHECPSLFTGCIGSEDAAIERGAANIADPNCATIGSFVASEFTVDEFSRAGHHDSTSIQFARVAQKETIVKG